VLCEKSGDLLETLCGVSNSSQIMSFLETLISEHHTLVMKLSYTQNCLLLLFKFHRSYFNPYLTPFLQDIYMLFHLFWFPLSSHVSIFVTSHFRVLPVFPSGPKPETSSKEWHSRSQWSNKKPIRLFSPPLQREPPLCNRDSVTVARQLIVLSSVKGCLNK
jgi:hypothetical protein